MDTRSFELAYIERRASINSSSKFGAEASRRHARPVERHNRGRVMREYKICTEALIYNINLAANREARVA